MSTNTKIGAGNTVLRRWDGTLGTPEFVDVGTLYDPLPELDLKREENDDTRTDSTWGRTRAGIKSASALAFKIKTDSAGLAGILTDFNSGDENQWEYVIPSEETESETTETLTLTAWVSNVKKGPSLKDETFVTFTLNINAVG
ncbi:hypothetical protein [Oceanobacter sp. 3_MG-2023]|uniref:hypothetical protein n=1 Tax=Oceanobacter sp. 3_MG-2023 TaxID=3062622 RepID=UPI002737463C|nr:hypothetical protein [Oceanobacter sp. 3_MG-2023]MDP2505384.1 hypothetical protein [Oceanobacter sp. 3_MG-2023]